MALNLIILRLKTLWGDYYAEQGQLDLAQRSFESALNNPFYQTPQLALYNLGLVYEKKGDPELALKQYQEAVRLQRNYGAAYYRMGQLLEQLRRADEAREAYGNAIEFAPDLVEAHYRYGVMSYTSGELENALYSLNRVVKLAPHSTMAEDARRYLERLQTILPSGPSSRTSYIQPSERVSAARCDDESGPVERAGGSCVAAYSSKRGREH